MNIPQHMIDGQRAAIEGRLNLDHIDIPDDDTEFFTQMGIPIPDMPTPSQVKKQARAHSEKIFEYWTLLRKVLDRHEDRLRKRWMKKTREQRKKILLAAWPNMSTNHRPDYQALLSQAKSAKREVYLFPFINLEDLSQPKNLLIFLNARGRHPPQMFSHADFEASYIGRASKVIIPAFLNGYTMFLTGTSPESYGRLVSWKDDPNSSELAISRRAFLPGFGLHTLECQERILYFLVQCCKIVLQEMDEATLIGEHSPVLPEPPAITNTKEWPSIAAMAQEAPYRLPALLDFEKIKGIIFARRAAAEDHVWGLREDPGYFAEIAGDYFEHRPETLLDTGGRAHPLVRELGKKKLWNYVLGQLLIDAYTSINTWDLLYRQVSELVYLKAKYSEIISPDKDLPKDYMKALMHFKFTLTKSQKRPIFNLRRGLPASPHFRSQYVRATPTSGNEMLIEIRRKQTYKPVGNEAHVLSLLHSVLWNEDQLFYHGLPNVMDELERVFDSDPKERAKLSTWVSDNYSELGVLAVVLHELNIYFPWAFSIDQQYLSDENAVKEEYAKQFKSTDGLLSCWTKLSLANLGAPTETDFRYPSDKRQNKQNIDIMRKSEQNLDAFWASVDSQYENRTGVSLQKAFQDFLSKDREIERTPEFIEPPKKPIDKPDPVASDHLHTSFGLLDTSTGDRISKLTFIPLKEKLKTRGAATSDSIDSQTAPDDTPQENRDIQPKFRVDKKVGKVFSALFHTMQTADQPGEIPWVDFLNAMVSTGFRPVKLYGSVWQFSPTSLDVERSIQFHEPHPRPKIPFRVARRIGRRLNRSYGWTGDMFEVA